MSLTYLKQIIAAGGPILIFLCLLSIYTLAVIWERYVAYKQFREGLNDAAERVRQALKDDKLDSALDAFKSQRDPVHWVFVRVMTSRGSRDERRVSCERVIERQMTRLRSGLTALGTIGSTAPFIGLFGTVLGVMRAFRDLAAFQGAGPAVVAVGISEALVATAAGLFVAIPSIVAYNAFQRRSEQFAEELTWLSEEVLERAPLS